MVLKMIPASTRPAADANKVDLVKWELDTFDETDFKAVFKLIFINPVEISQ